MLLYLRPDAQTKTEIQDTEFTKDLMGRYVCSTFDEAANNGGRPFDVVIIGAGMFGAYAAEKIYRKSNDLNLRILVLDAGSHLFSTHVQNLPHVGLNSPDPALVRHNGEDPGPRRGVWGVPWHSNREFTGIAYCPGGRSLFWGGWAPRMTSADLATWPEEVRRYLDANYDDVEEEIGVKDEADYLSGELDRLVKKALEKATKMPVASKVTFADVEDAPLAVQASQPGSGLFSFDKYSSVPIFYEAIRDDINRRWTLDDNSRRRLFLVPKAHVIRLVRTSAPDVVDRIELAVSGRPVTLERGTHLSPGCQIVLALGTIESTRLALESFPVAGMGGNFMAHLRTNLFVRVKRSALGLAASKKLEQGGALVRGEIENPDGSKRRIHLQVLSSAAKGNNPEATMWTMVPDIDLFRGLLANQSFDWVTVVLRGIGEMDGDKSARPGSANSFITLGRAEDPGQRDQFGAQRAWVQYAPTKNDEAAWSLLARAGVDLASNLAPRGDVQYLVGGAWRDAPPDPEKTKDNLGTTHHEAGTLWMGDDRQSSITDENGRFHHVKNVFAVGPAIFPTVASANPSLTGLTLARKTVNAMAEMARPKTTSVLKPMYAGDLRDWQMAGFGNFVQVFDILESQGGPGILWYTREAFDDFVLELEWQYASRTDNSGIFIRIPSLNSSRPDTDPLAAIEGGYEIQIDPRGFNAETNRENDPLRSTGAIYALSPAIASGAERAPWQWNTFVIEAIGARIRVSLNGVLVNDFTDPNQRSLRGHIGLQNHHPGSKVQFRNIRIRTPSQPAPRTDDHSRRIEGSPSL
jgi:hypothetical protein